MRLIIINFIISFIVLSIICYRWDNCIEIGDIFFSAIMSILLSILLSIAIFLIISITANTQEYISNEQEITCLTDNSSLEGAKFLFSGYINEKQIYKTFVLNSDGSKSYKEYNTDNSKIYEDGQNKVVTYGAKFTNKIVIWLLNEEIQISQNRYEIHIPTDSITTEFNIDLNN